MKKDDVALAIARQREAAKADRSAKAGRPAADDAGQRAGHAVNVVGHRKARGGAPSPSTKRPKTFGS